jgi:hypothetical protein
LNTVVLSAKLRAEARRARRRLLGDITAKRLILKALASAESLSTYQIHQQTGVKRDIVDMTLSRLRADESVARVPGSVRRGGLQNQVTGGLHQITAKGRAVLRGQAVFDSHTVVEQARKLPNSVFALGEMS